MQETQAISLRQDGFARAPPGRSERLGLCATSPTACTAPNPDSHRLKAHYNNNVWGFRWLHVLRPGSIIGVHGR